MTRRRLPREAHATLRAWADTIARRPLLTAAEERELAAQARAGDATARERMIESNLRLVLSVVPYYVRQGGGPDYGLSVDDLIQEGVIGLALAVDRFDPERGLRFSTYAMPWVKMKITRLIDERGLPIRVTRRARIILEDAGEPIPVVSTSCDARATPDPVEGYSLPVSHPVASGPSPEAECVAADHRRVMAEHLDTLPPRLARLARLRYGFTPDGEALTLEAIGQRFGLTRERIRQLEVEMLRLLRQRITPESI